MKRLVSALSVVALLASGAAAQFSQFTWTLENPFGFITSLSADSMLLGGGSGGIPAGASAQYSAVAPVDAVVTAKGTTIATPKGDCGDSHGFYGAENDLKVLSDCTTGAPLVFTVHAGESMVFGLKIVDSTLPGDAFYSSFAFRPFWQPLGGALAGSAGLPTLVGQGVIEPGEPVTLQVSNAAPAAAATLVIGLDQVNLPFKGGVLVPEPSVLVPGLVTDATGSLELDGVWPAGAATAFLAQLWIADAGGPKGFAATNAVQGFGL
jgi:hypothetical protein